jgi:hypothetical protein
VPKRVRGDVADACILRGPGQLVAQRLGGQPAAVVGEQELCALAGARVRDRRAARAVRHDPVDQRDGLVVQGHHPLGVQLAERHLQPRSLAGHFMDAVQFQVGQLADAQPAGPLQQQRVGGQPVRGGLQCCA